MLQHELKGATSASLFPLATLFPGNSDPIAHFCFSTAYTAQAAIRNLTLQVSLAIQQAVEISQRGMASDDLAERDLADEMELQMFLLLMPWRSPAEVQEELFPTDVSDDATDEELRESQRNQSRSVPESPWPKLRRLILWSIGVELVTTSVLRGLEELCIQHASTEHCNMLIKNYQKHARNDAQENGRVAAAMRIYRVTVLSRLLAYAASNIVSTVRSSAVHAVAWYRERGAVARTVSGTDIAGTEASSSSAKTLRVTSKIEVVSYDPDSMARSMPRKSWIRTTAETPVISVVHNLISSLGAVVGTLIAPGAGTYLGVTVFDLLAAQATTAIFG